MKSRAELRELLPMISEEQLDTLQSIQLTGFEHGAAGWYEDGDFTSDADWCSGVGAQISQLEHLLQDTFGQVFAIYLQAHEEGQEEFRILNPEEE